MVLLIVNKILRIVITGYGTYCGILGYSKRHNIWQYGPKGFLNVVPDREKGGILRETGVTAEPD